ncbi:MAG TPA: hypothetical protein VGH63_15175, partial [Polyangia bacterium]
MRWLVAVALLGVASAALADTSDADKSRARQLFQSARQHYNLGEFADALKDFKEAYRVVDDPTLLFN